MPTIEEIIMGQLPEPAVFDPASDAREKEIWEKIMKGPRERARELTAEGWKSRYGVDEKSGKLKKGFAAVGEVARALSQAGTKNYVSIQDEAAQRGMEEYKAEVGPLQRELGVLTQAKTAAAKMMHQKAASDLAAQVRAYAAAVNATKTAAQTAAIEAKFPAEVKKIAAETGLLLERTRNVIQDTENDKATGGLSGVFGAANAWKDPVESADQRRTWADMEGLKNALTGASVPKTAVQVPGTAGATRTFQTDQGLQTIPVPQTTRTVLQADPAARAAAVNKARGQFLGGAGNAPGTPLIPPVASGGPIPGVPPDSQIPSARPPAQEPVIAADGTAYAPRPNAPARTAQFRQGRFTETGIDPTWDGALKGYLGGQSAADLPPAIKQRFPGQIFPGMGKTTEAQRTQTEFRNSLRGLTDEAMKAYANDELYKSTGIPGNLLSAAKGMISGGLDMTGVKTRAQAVQTLASYILKVSGKAVTENERKILNQALPNLERDADSTLLQKTLVIQNIARRQEWQKGLRLNDADMDAVAATPSGRRALSMDQKVFSILDAINKAARNGKSEVVITNGAGQSMTVSKQRAMDLARATMEEDYKLLTKGLSEAFR